jgi:hypothetical protein
MEIGNNSNSPREKKRMKKTHKGRIKYNNTSARELTKRSIGGTTSRGGISRYITRLSMGQKSWFTKKKRKSLCIQPNADDTIYHSVTTTSSLVGSSHL